MMARPLIRLALSAAGLLLASSAGLAAGQATTHQAKPSAATQAALARAQQKLQQQQAQVAQLQGTVVKQEADSKQASERLQQQDKAITQMQQELQAPQECTASGRFSYC
jgi:uncharacterized protein YlxW (UPF0749 family)